MPGIHRCGDLVIGHGCWPNHAAATCSSRTFVNGIGAVRVGDITTPHCCPPCHSGSYIGGSNTIIETRQVQVCGSPVDCGSTAGACSSDSFANLI